MSNKLLKKSDEIYREKLFYQRNWSFVGKHVWNAYEGLVIYKLSFHFCFRSNQDFSIYSLVASSSSRPGSASHPYPLSPLSFNNTPEPSWREQQHLSAENMKGLLRRPFKENTISTSSDPTPTGGNEPPGPFVVTSSDDRLLSSYHLNLKMRMRRSDVINLPLLANRCEPVLLEKARTIATKDMRMKSGVQGKE